MVVRLGKNLETCPLCDTGALVAYVRPDPTSNGSSERGSTQGSGVGRFPSTAGGRQNLRVCDDCGGAVLHAW